MAEQMVLDGFNDDTLQKRLNQLGECYLDGWFFSIDHLLSDEVIIEIKANKSRSIVGRDAVKKAFERIYWNIRGRKKYKYTCEIVRITSAITIFEDRPDFVNNLCLYSYRFVDDNRTGALHYLFLDDKDKISKIILCSPAEYYFETIYAVKHRYADLKSMDERGI